MPTLATLGESTPLTGLCLIHWGPEGGAHRRRACTQAVCLAGWWCHAAKQRRWGGPFSQGHMGDDHR
ncbi:unnamed protein product [Arctogadus glacialis]